MKYRLLFKVKAFVMMGAFIIPFELYAQTDYTSLLNREFELGKERSQEIQYYHLNTEMISYALDGNRTSRTVLILNLRCTPAAMAKKDGDEYTCTKFLIKDGDSTEVSIPELEKWSYIFRKGIDSKNQVFGIEHKKFYNLRDINGNVLRQDKAYHVYNAFIDFHTVCDIFVERTTEGKGIQDLKKIGEQIIHSAAYSQVPVNLGQAVSEGSYFKNGKITLELKGLSSVNGRPCVLLDYDSGESMFRMRMKQMPDMEIGIVGSSHYMGNFYKDITSGWIQKATLHELAIIETTLPMPPNKINSVVERNIVILNVPEEKIKY